MNLKIIWGKNRNFSYNANNQYTLLYRRYLYHLATLLAIFSFPRYSFNHIPKKLHHERMKILVSCMKRGRINNFRKETEKKERNKYNLK